MVIYVDIDETICSSIGRNYYSALPLEKNIHKINKLFDKGHTIVYWTARGTTDGNDYTLLTKSQLRKWGVKCHTILMGKPFYDLIIDDKACTMENIDEYID